MPHFFRRFSAASLLISIAGCTQKPPELAPLPVPEHDIRATVREEGAVAPLPANGQTFVRMGSGTRGGLPGNTASGGGDISLNFAGTDIHAVTEQILGGILHVNYVIDPSVQGTATLHTAQPLRRDQLIPTLRVLLAGANATLVTQSGLYRVVSLSSGGGPGAGAGSANSTTAIPLRYTNAASIAKLIQPVVQGGGHVAADPDSNTIILSGDPATRETLTELVHTFDTDTLAGQSYLLLPATTGTVSELSQALKNALGVRRTGGENAGPDSIRLFPMPSIDSILVTARQPRLIEDARRAFSVIEAGRKQTVRNWSAFYLQNGRANDVAYVLQQAFTPEHVTATPTPSPKQQTGMNSSNSNSSSGFGSMSGSSGLGSGQSGSMASGNSSGDSSSGAFGSSLNSTSGQNQTTSQNDGISNNPLLGGLGNMSENSENSSHIRIIPDLQNNSVLVYGTRAETETITAMLHKIDIMPLQVMVDATVAEVTLNDSLEYGTQFFFKSGGINGILSTAKQSLGGANLVSSQLSSSFPGFVLGGSGQGGAPFVINALQSVTKVRVLSSPQIMVVDNQPASLMVGNLVPYLTGATTSVVTSNSTITNSINYQPTGVILQVTPHVSNTGLVTLDISQQVSSVSSSTTSTGSSSINSPTFSQRQVSSRVAIEDGQTVGLAGLITDNASRGNQGLPWLKDIPILGMLGSQQTNVRERTELLVLITPHVIRSQNDARAMTEDLRRNLAQSAALAPELARTPQTGSPDPQQRILKAVGLHD
ncbi:type II secretion system secretin GspD [Acetobacter persici]|uniref:type II secretion system secretin GspD n=1 Tax=Acetobacter persici TaxID=1076596 RepID=UPI001BA5AD9B|nr:type II secretion system secretin GspD [Acetobacter persici]MBS1001542.1 type II secretion system secretin GspD [Acetobacter persici]